MRIILEHTIPSKLIPDLIINIRFITKINTDKPAEIVQAILEPSKDKDRQMHINRLKNDVTYPNDNDIY